MSDKPSFGRDVNEFLETKCGMGKSEKECSDGVEILSLSYIGNERVMVRGQISSGSHREDFEFAVLECHAKSMELSVGSIDASLLPEIEYFAEVARAYVSACASFAYAPSSYSALWKKLVGKGFQKDVCDDAIDCARQNNLLNEEEIALRRAQIFVGKRWGRMRIVMKLREEGFDDSSLKLTKKYLDETDFGEVCAKHIRKKYGNIPEDDHGKKLMYASLSRMGFSSSDIREAIKKF